MVRTYEVAEWIWANQDPEKGIERSAVREHFALGTKDWIRVAQDFLTSNRRGGTFQGRFTSPTWHMTHLGPDRTRPVPAPVEIWGSRGIHGRYPSANAAETALQAARSSVLRSLNTGKRFTPRQWKYHADFQRGLIALPASNVLAEDPYYSNYVYLVEGPTGALLGGTVRISRGQGQFDVMVDRIKVHGKPWDRSAGERMVTAHRVAVILTNPWPLTIENEIELAKRYHHD